MSRTRCAFSAALRSAIRSTGMSDEEFAQWSGIPYGWIRYATGLEEDPKWLTYMRRIRSATGKDWKELMA